MTTLVPPNKFGGLQVTNTVTNGDPIEIRHFQIGVDGSVAGFLNFTIKRVEPTDLPANINKYVQDIASGNKVAMSFVNPPPSPFDMIVSDPCFIVVELAPDVKNWQFETGTAALTTKDTATEDNWGLVHAYADGRHSAGIATRDGCRVIYFGVAKRGAYQSSFVNLHTEFLQLPKRLRVIFDPDVPNDGDPFP